jgi:predicted histone-like DNA-binding protein
MKWYATPIVNETFDLDALANHMSNHNSPYSKGVITGILTDMVECIKELLLDGKQVKIDDLAIFRVSIVSKKGCENKADYKVSEYVDHIVMRSLASGALSTSNLNADFTLKRASLDKDDAGDVSADDVVASTPETSNPSTGGGDEDDDDEFIDPTA